MTSVEMFFSEFEEMYIKTDYDGILSYISVSRNKLKINSELHALFIFYETRVLIKQGNLKKAESLIKGIKAFNTADGNDLRLEDIILICTMGNVLLTLGRITDLDNTFQKIIHGSKKLKAEVKDQAIFKHWISFTYFLKGLVNLYNFKIEKAISEMKNSLKGFLSLNSPLYIGNCYYYLANIYFDKPDSLESIHLNYFEKAIVHYNKIDYKRGIGNSYLFTAHSLIMVAKFKKAETFLQKAEKLLSHEEDIGSKIWFNIILSQYYVQQNQLEAGKNLLLLNFDYFSTYNNTMLLAENLMNILIVNLKEKELLKAELYLNQLENLNKTSPNKRIEFYFKLGNGIIKSRKNDLQSKAEAISLLQDLLENEQYQAFRGWSIENFKSMAIINLVNIKIEEYLIFKTSEKLQEALDLVNSFLKSDFYHTPDYIELLIVKSKILQIQELKEEALTLLKHGLEKATESQFERVIDIIKKEINQLSSETKIDEFKKREIFESISLGLNYEKNVNNNLFDRSLSFKGLNDLLKP